MPLQRLFASCAVACCIALSSALSDPLDPAKASDCPSKDEPNDALSVKCGFDRESLTFAGSAADTAKCLLRPIAIGGISGPTLAKLPPPLDSLIDKSVGISVDEFAKYLKEKNIEADDLGGPLSRPLSTSNNNDPNGKPARYFVIHDTSSPKYRSNKIPERLPDNGVINSEAWPGNKLEGHANGCDSKAHVFINRLGQSLTAVQFETAWRATRLEMNVVGRASQGRFLHVENIQPREHDPDHHDPDPEKQNDRIAPNPGFAKPQIARLALVYVAASVRKGTWLVPGFHAAIDDGIPGGHDDPQNFVLAEWACQIHGILVELKKKQPGKCP